MKLSKTVDKKVTKIAKIAKANGVSYQDAAFTWEATGISRRVDGFLSTLVQVASHYLDREMNKGGIKPIGTPTSRLVLETNENALSAHEIEEGDYVRVKDEMQDYWLVLHGIEDDSLCGFILNEVMVPDNEDLKVGQHMSICITNIFEVRKAFPTKEYFEGKEIKQSDFRIYNSVVPFAFMSFFVVKLFTLDNQVVWVQILEQIEEGTWCGVILNELNENEPYFLNKGDVVTFFEFNAFEVKNIDAYKQENDGEQAPAESTTKES